MDIQAEKIELAKLILSTDDTGIIKKVKALFKRKMKINGTAYPQVYAKASTNL